MTKKSLKLYSILYTYNMNNKLHVQLAAQKNKCTANFTVNNEYN